MSKNIPWSMLTPEARAKKLAYDKAWRGAHREERRIACKKSYANHREEHRAYNKTYRATHREEDQARQKVYRSTHREEARARQRAYYAAHPKHREEARVRSLFRNHGLSKSEFDTLLKSQGDVCAICRKADWRGRSPYVDHDHKTGKIRGILCFKCNAALGLIEDNIQNAQAMITYLREATKEHAL